MLFLLAILPVRVFRVELSAVRFFSVAGGVAHEEQLHAPLGTKCHDGVRKNPKGRKFNQKLAQWEYGEDKKYIQEKAARAAIASTPLRSGRLRAASRGANATPAPRPLRSASLHSGMLRDVRYAAVAGARGAGAGNVLRRPADAGFPDIAT